MPINDGAPTYLHGGAAVPLIYGDAGWGWYDHGHQWHGAPGRVAHDLEARRVAGAHFHEGVIARGHHPDDHH